jgi:outer membrane protein OmpA-like peptidoglycan-associated protein
MIKVLFSSLLLLPILFSGPCLAGEECSQAKELYQQAARLSAPQAKLKTLQKVIRICPDHAPAWNDLGVVYERSGREKEAMEAYRRSIQADPGLPAPHAGLGDLAMARGDFATAKKSFARFLDLLEKEKVRGDPFGLAKHEADYRDKLSRAELKSQIQTASAQGVVDKGIIVRGLRRIGRNRPERIALQNILFDFNSAELKAGSLPQLREMVQALVSPELTADRFQVAGHTDAFGSQVYNQKLSKKRAWTVMDFLVREGIPAQRLEARGYGETKLIVWTGSKEEQAINRRVEFVNLGQ